MNVEMRSLPEMTVAYFDGFKPDPEIEAHRLKSAWLESRPEIARSCRVFGYNIDSAGDPAHDPDNEGYRVMVTVPQHLLPLDDGTPTLTIAPGEFIVVGIEGSFEADPTGSWITEGWLNLQTKLDYEGLHTHPSHRWFEEEMEATEPGNARFDLYVEIE